MVRAGSSKVAPDMCTNSIVIGCCCHFGRLDLGFAVFGKILKLGRRVNTIFLNQLVKDLCDVKRMSKAMYIVVRRMREFRYMPDVVSYNTLVKVLCGAKRSQEALDLLHMMLEDEGKQAVTVQIW
ncbi:hypothetical protein QOZ80_2BG0165660 [Eleusine coracana subsp. coracana]|nr:hypothetical protein QOZ80_2BG0165660 [Eleusine coracana subsp. coracana]